MPKPSNLIISSSWYLIIIINNLLILIKGLSLFLTFDLKVLSELLLLKRPLAV